MLELTVAVAQAGEKTVPPLPAPTALRPFLHFTRKVPPPALRAARKVLDDDEVFRARVASVATDELVGRAGVLYAARPEGWEEELATLVDGVVGEVDDLTGRKADRQLQRRLEGAETAARRAEQAMRKAEDVAARARAELVVAQGTAAAERTARGAAEAALAEARHQVTEVSGARDRAEAEADALRAELAALWAEASALRSEAAALQREAEQRQALDMALASAVAAVEEVRRSLGDLVQAAATGDDEVLGFEAAAPTVSDRPTRSRADGRSGGPGGAGNGSRRRPTSLPPAVFADSTEAAQYLLRVPDVLVLVDGYNVAKWKWTDTTLPDQRARLVAALAELAARTGADIHVVFDGADDPRPPAVPQTGRRPVRVSFSPPGVEADDVILGLVAGVPEARPLVVVSSDRRVRDGAAALGANTVSSQQFVAAWGAASFLSHPSR